MAERIETGEAALVEALKRAGVALVAGVYGDPVTSLLDRCAAQGLNVEISVEEKTAFAQALGASCVGRRAVVAVKQVGMNVLADPLVTAATHGIGAGLLVICGDDPGAAKSQNEQDSRWYAKLAELPVLTPYDPPSLAGAAVEGLRLSEELGIPVLLQITGRLTQMPAPPEGVRLPEAPGPAPRFDRARAWGRFILERHKFHLQTIWPRLQEHVEASPLNRLHRPDAGSAGSAEGREGVIACGVVASLVPEGVPLFKLGYAHPLPERALLSFLRGLEAVLVAEEVAPFVEEGVRALVGAHGLRVKVRGRLTGHLPRVGPLEARHVERALRTLRDEPEGENFDVQVQLSDSLQRVPCGGFEKLYQALKEALPEGHPVAGDVGCSILYGYFPPQVVTTAYALGTSIATAAGMSLQGRKGVAVIGDVGFLHSGIPALLDAVEFGHDVLVIVLHNRVSAMTPGEQPIRGLDKLRALVDACGPDAVDEVDVDAATPEELKALIERRFEERGVHVVIARATPRPFGFPQ